MKEKLQEFISEAGRILITSHISPDPDAVCSALLLGRTLQENYHGKKIAIVLEEEPLSDVSFLEGYGQVEFKPLVQKLRDFRPDIFIVTDANNFDRVSRDSGAQIRSHVESHKGEMKTVIIDHHELDGHDDVDILINNKRPAATEEIYVLCFEQMQLKKPAGYAETTLLGIVSDTQRHRFDHPGYRETYRITADLLDAGASIEKLESRLEHHNKNELEAISHLASNIRAADGFTYTYFDDDFFNEWQARNKPAVDLKNAAELFVNKFIRSFEDNKWGFIVYPDMVSGPGWWGVSFRSVSGVKDVSTIARRLGGGGHKPAAGVKIQAGNAKEALSKVIEAIR